MNRKLFLLILFFLSVFLTIHTRNVAAQSGPEGAKKYEFKGSNVRVTGPVNGDSYAEETKNATPINGNVHGVPFSMWITGQNENLGPTGTEPYFKKDKEEERLPEPAVDETRVLRSSDVKEYLDEDNSEGVLKSDQLPTNQVKENSSASEIEVEEDNPQLDQPIVDETKPAGVLISK